MHAELATRRRVLLVIYQRYATAEHAWSVAQQETKAWFPQAHHSPAIIGDPGSAIRRLYDQRLRAILQLEVARLKLQVARQRLERRSGRHEAHPLFLTQPTLCVSAAGGGCQALKAESYTQHLSSGRLRR